MHTILALLILGMGLSGAVLIISVSLLFNPPIGNILMIVTASSTTAFAIFAISAVRFRRQLDEIRD